MMTDQNKVFTVAERILATDPSCDTMKLHKLLYYVQGWSQAWTGHPLFHEAPEAWMFGPVYRSVYAAQKRETLHSSPTSTASLTKAEIAVIDAVVSAYKTSDPWTLAERTHQEEPWIEARAGLPSNAPSSEQMSLQTMMRYFSTASGPERPQALDCDFQPVSRSFMESENQRWAGLLARLGS